MWLLVHCFESAAGYDGGGGIGLHCVGVCVWVHICLSIYWMAK